jgi:hypothetical protein
VDFYHEKGDDELAFCCGDAPNRCARIHLNTNWPKDIEITKSTIRQTAFHEVCELRFCAYHTLASDRYGSEVALNMEKHAIIRMLENVLFRNSQ